MTEYNGETLTYDTIGNPLTYRDGMSMTWKHGRSLQSIVKGGVTQGSYNYNGDGLRTKKITAGNGEVEYHILDGQYVGETQTINGKTYHTLYLYDDAGNIIGLQENGETYYLSRTLQGDVTAVLDESGTKVARYVYDTWGNIVGVYDGADDEVTDPEHIGLRNPFRYRGYMYDEESGLYYLQSRYYDPVTGRFVNADGFVSTGTGLMGHNMFAYCNDNPVMYVDPNGQFLTPVHYMQAMIDTIKYDMLNNPNTIYCPLDILKLLRKIDDYNNLKSSPFLNSDGSYSLYDNKRFDSDKLFHEQIAAFKCSPPSFSPKKGDLTIGSYNASLVTGGWEWDHADLSLLDFGSAKVSAGISGGGFKASAMASIWSPSFSMDVFGYNVSFSAHVGSVGGQFNIGKEGLQISGAWGVGAGLSIRKN